MSHAPFIAGPPFSGSFTKYHRPELVAGHLSGRSKVSSGPKLQPEGAAGGSWGTGTFLRARSGRSGWSK
eukprot:12122865-Alexandrium_andersonii.AAC.1